MPSGRRGQWTVVAADVLGGGAVLSEGSRHTEEVRVHSAKRHPGAQQALPAEALAALGDGAVRRLPARLVALRIEALAALGRLDAALDDAAGALERTTPDDYLQLAALGARIAEDTAHFDLAQWWLDAAHKIAESFGSRVENLTVAVAELRLQRRSGSASSKPAAELRSKVIEGYEQLTSQEKIAHPALIRELAAEVGTEIPALVSEAARIVGIDVRGGAGDVIRRSLHTEDVRALVSSVAESAEVARYHVVADTTATVATADPGLVWIGAHTSVEQGRLFSSYLDAGPSDRHGDAWHNALVEGYRSEVDTPNWAPETPPERA